MATQILLKLNQFPSSIQSSPNEWFNSILTQLNEWLLIIPNFFHSIFSKLGKIFSGENLGHWLSVAKPYLLVGLGVVLLCLVCYCVLPVIIGCISLILVAIWNLILWVFSVVWGLFAGLFRVLLRFCTSVFNMCCCCCRRSARMMKAPGRGGKVFMPRASFEGNPRAYFRNLRAGGSVNSAYNSLR